MRGERRSEGYIEFEWEALEVFISGHDAMALR